MCYTLTYISSEIYRYISITLVETQVHPKITSRCDDDTTNDGQIGASALRESIMHEVVRLRLLPIDSSDGQVSVSNHVHIEHQDHALYNGNRAHGT